MDHLAFKFMNEGWDMKNLMKYMLMSASYRQDSFVSAEKLKKKTICKSIQIRE